MADMDYLASLNDTQFRAALQRIESTGKAHAARMNRTMSSAGMAAGAAWGRVSSQFARLFGAGLTIRSVTGWIGDFAARNDRARQSVDNLSRSWGRLKDSIASDITAGPAGGGVIDWLNRFRERFVDELVQGFFADAPTSEDLRQDDARNAAISARARAADMLRRADLELTRIIGSESARAQAEYEENVRGIDRTISREYSTLPTDERGIIRERMVEVERARRDRAIADARAAAAADVARAAAEREQAEKRRADVLRQVRDIDAISRIEEIAARGDTDRAARLRVIYEYERRIDELRQSAALSEQDRASAEAVLTQAMRRDLAVLGADDDRGTRVASASEAGFAAARGAIPLLFGGASRPSAERQALQTQQQMRDYLRRIAENTARETITTYQ